jgi:hypothetical protein
MDKPLLNKDQRAFLDKLQSEHDQKKLKEAYIILAYKFFEDPITQKKQLFADVVSDNDAIVKQFSTPEEAQEYIIREEVFGSYVVVRVEE